MVAQYISIDQAATALGVTERALRRLARAGRLPEAKFVGDRWVVAYKGLPAIATRERFVLDLTDAKQERPPEQPFRHSSPCDGLAETTHPIATAMAGGPTSTTATAMAAATMASAEAIEATEAMATAVRHAEHQLATAQAETSAIKVQLEALQAEFDRQSRDQATATQYTGDLQTYANQVEDQNDELQAQLREANRKVDEERYERAALAARYKALEVERKDLLACMDWFTKRRFSRRQAGREQFRRTVENNNSLLSQLQ